MARKGSTGTKEPGRIAQMWQVFQMTRRYDSKVVPLLLATLLGPIVLAILLAIFVPGQSLLGSIVWIVIGVMAGVLLTLLLLGRRAERAAFGQIEGQAGAVGAVIKSGLRGTWRGSEMPVAVNPRTQDAVYRVVGKGGVVLVTEGSAKNLQKVLGDEQRKVRRVLPNVTISVLSVGDGKDSLQLHQLNRKLNKMKATLNKTEILAVGNRLSSLGGNLPIPKGVDPFKARPQRAR